MHFGRRRVIASLGGLPRCRSAGQLQIARSPADGYTALYHASGIAIAPAIYKCPGYDPARDFVRWSGAARAAGVQPE